MVRAAFYDSIAYRAKQSAITTRNQRLGVYDHLKVQTTRICVRDGCAETFVVKVKDRKRFCSQRCAVITNNLRRIQSLATKKKISNALKGRVNPFKGVVKVPRTQTPCINPGCVRLIIHERYKLRKFCSNTCQMNVVGRAPTSPKASRGKAGIRQDISPHLYFYSRWEANMARLYTYLSIRWEYAPRTFNIDEQMYTPDFYLPETETYIEVKNFWNEYAQIRDAKFRETHPQSRLEVLLKEEYKTLEQQYALVIPHWEFSNSSL